MLCRALADELERKGVERGVVRAPWGHVMQHACKWHGGTARKGRFLPVWRGNHRLQHAAEGIAHQGGVKAETTLCLGGDKDIFQVGRFFDFKRNGAVNPAECHIVNHMPKGWLRNAFVAIAFYGNDVFGIVI